MRQLLHPKPWLLFIALFYIVGTAGALECEAISIIQGIAQAIGGLIMLCTAALMPDPEGL